MNTHGRWRSQPISTAAIAMNTSPAADLRAARVALAAAGSKESNLTGVRRQQRGNFAADASN
jgi:hypothetical protein